MTLFDGRISAWAAAWQAVSVARQQRELAFQQKPGDYRDDLMQVYGCLMDEANVLTRLASVQDSTLGFAVGDWLEQEAQREQQQREEAGKAWDKLFESRLRTCNDCGEKFPQNKMWVLPGTEDVYVCHEDYGKRAQE